MVARVDRAGVAVLLSQAVPPRPRLTRLQAHVSHELAHQLEPARHAPGDQVGVHTPVPVGAVGVLERFVDIKLQLLTALRSLRQRPIAPWAWRVKPLARSLASS